MYSIKIKEIREEKKLKQKEISEILNIDESSYGKYEREDLIFPIKHLNNFCNYFNISFDYIFGFSKKRNYLNSNKGIKKVESGKRLKELRKEKKLTLKEIGYLSSNTYGAIGDYEKGRAIISTKALYFICKEYNISADYLLGKIDEPKYLK